MSAEMAAAVLDGLPPVPCMAPIPWPRATEVNVVTSTRRRRVCTLPNGHGQFEIPCSYAWVEEHVDVPDPELGDEF